MGARSKNEAQSKDGGTREGPGRQQRMGGTTTVFCDVCQRKVVTSVNGPNLIGIGAVLRSNVSLRLVESPEGGGGKRFNQS